MPVDRSRDTPARQRLEALVNRLSDAELATPLADGWTVASSLAHLAFWDTRAAIVVERWTALDSVRPSQADVDVINHAAKPQWLALPPRVAGVQAVEAARLADAALDSASSELIDQIAAKGSPINLSRAAHRLEHLDEIERALGRKSH